MRRASLLVVLTAIALGVTVVEKSMGQTRSGAQVRVEKALTTFDSEIEKLSASVEQHFAKLEKAAMAQNDLVLMSQIAAERADFDRLLELPLSILPSTRQRFAAVRTPLFQAYTKALAEFEPGRKTVGHEKLEKEFQALKDRTAGIDIDGSVAARIGASLGATNKYQLNKAVAQLTQRVNARLVLQIEKTTEEIGIGGSLPNRPFLVTEIHFPEGTAVQDSDLLQISTLAELQKLSVRGSNVTDVGVKHISILRKMKSINLHATKITNRSLFMLAEMGTLEEIDVGYNENVTDEGIRALGSLTGLRNLQFGSKQITPDMVRWIQTKLKKK